MAPKHGAALGGLDFMHRHLDALAFDFAPVPVLFLGRQAIGQCAPVRVFRREAHVNEVQVEGLAAGLAIFGGPAAVGLFVYLECCNHVDCLSILCVFRRVC